MRYQPELIKTGEEAEWKLGESFRASDWVI